MAKVKLQHKTAEMRFSYTEDGAAFYEAEQGLSTIALPPNLFSSPALLD